MAFHMFGLWRMVTLDTKGRVAPTNGCIDLLHRSHCELLEDSWQQGDILIGDCDTRSPPRYWADSRRRRRGRLAARLTS